MKIGSKSRRRRDGDEFPCHLAYANRKIGHLCVCANMGIRCVIFEFEPPCDGLGVGQAADR